MIVLLIVRMLTENRQMAKDYSELQNKVVALWAALNEKGCAFKLGGTRFAFTTTDKSETE